MTTVLILGSSLLLGILSSATAGTVTLTGFLNDPANPALRSSMLSAALFSNEFEIANNIAVYELMAGAESAVRFQSRGFAAGGVDPYFSIFSDVGAGAAFFNSNFDQAFSTGGDFDLTFALPPGPFTAVIGVFANVSFAENLGVGILGDGFTGLGVPGLLGTSYYELQVTDSDVGVPEPSYLPLTGTIGAMLIWGALPRRRANKSHVVDSFRRRR